MTEEIELTYLAKRLPDGLAQSPSVDMLDIYIPQAAAHPKLRIRRMGARLEMTKKRLLREDDASRQTEETISLDEDEFEALSKLPGKRVEKKRYILEEGGIRYEIDVSGGGLKGLVLVDVEFASPEERDVFEPPDWCLADVTQEEFAAGGMLCGKDYEDIEDLLGKFGYEKIG